MIEYKVLLIGSVLLSKKKFPAISFNFYRSGNCKTINFFLFTATLSTTFVKKMIDINDRFVRFAAFFQRFGFQIHNVYVLNVYAIKLKLLKEIDF